MDLSIIIPAHNLEGYIEKCIDSILSQNIENICCEIIFICDCCEDNTELLIRNKMKKVCWNWRLEKVNYKSPGLTRNKGLDLALGDYIWFIDGDDWLIDNEAIQCLITTAKDDPTLDRIRFHFASEGYKNLGMHVSVWQYLFKKSYIGDLRFIEATPREDNLFIRELNQKKHKQIKINDCFYFYNHPREGSVMYKDLEKNPRVERKLPRGHR